MTTPVDLLVLDASPAAQRAVQNDWHRGRYFHHRSCWAWWVQGHVVALAWGHRALRRHRKEVTP